MTADHDTDRPDYDPSDPTPPAEEPPLRSTAPQSEFTGRQALVGTAVLVVGLLVTFALPLVLA